MAVGGSRFFFSSGFLKPSPEPCGGTAGSGGRGELSRLSPGECVPVMEGAAEQRGNKCVLPPSPPPTRLHSDASSQQMEVGICTVLHEWKLTRHFFLKISLPLRRESGVRVSSSALNVHFGEGGEVSVHA